LYVPLSSVDRGNSTIFEKLLLFKVVFHSANSTLSTLSFKTPTTTASYPSFSRVLNHTTYKAGTASNVIGMNLSSFITLVISSLVAIIQAILKYSLQN
jgi:hypothetical protein